MPNKRKIINDPVFGFLTIPNELVYDVLQHPYVQRLSRIRQLGLSYFVYPGATHSRFLHSLGAMHLMQEGLATLRNKGVALSDAEIIAAQIAILLHDIGHGPFSHVLEHTLVDGITHEQISLLMMEQINRDLQSTSRPVDQKTSRPEDPQKENVNCQLSIRRKQIGRTVNCQRPTTDLDLAIAIFQNQYPRHFLHQLISSQLDVDRMDYLCRDSFFCGVQEGRVASERLLKMLNVVNDRLVVELKGIYSVEKFLVARRLMYWQVYLHKTSVAAEQLLIKVLTRAKELASSGIDLFCSPALHYFLYNHITAADFMPTTNDQRPTTNDQRPATNDQRPATNDQQPTTNDQRPTTALRFYAMLDDSDVLSAIKAWTAGPDRLLALLATAFTNRSLFRGRLLTAPLSPHEREDLRTYYSRQLSITPHEADYCFVEHLSTSNTYSEKDDSILILYNDGTVHDIAAASEILDLNTLTRKPQKLYLFQYRI